MDPGEEVHLAAKRELLEETGFTIGKSYDSEIPCRVVYCDPWKSNESEVMIVVEIDGDAVENASPKQTLDQDENIVLEVVSGLGKDTLASVHRLCDEKGYELSSSVNKFLAGLAIGASL